MDFRTIPTVWYFFVFFSLSLNVIYIFLYFNRKVKDDYRLFKKLNIPGPDPVMVLGSIHEFRDKVCKYESQIRKGSDFFSRMVIQCAKQFGYLDCNIESVIKII